MLEMGNITSLVLISLNIIVIFLLALSLYFVLKSHRKNISDEKLLISSNAYKKAFELLSVAQEESRKIINSSNLKVLELINNLKTTSSDEAQLIHQELESIVKGQLNRMNEIKKRYEDEYESEIQNATKRATLLVSETNEELISIAKDEITNFENSLRTKTINSQDAVQARIKKEYETLEIELDRYSKERKKEVEDHIYDIIIGVFSDIFKFGISMQEHEKLIRISLEQGMKERGFTNDNS